MVKGEKMKTKKLPVNSVRIFHFQNIDTMELVIFSEVFQDHCLVLSIKDHIKEGYGIGKEVRKVYNELADEKEIDFAELVSETSNE